MKKISQRLHPNSDEDYAAEAMKLFVLALLATANLIAAEITVFAAASLTDALKEIASSYEKSTGEKVRFNLAASNTLAQQIQAGAPADLFISADEAKMNQLDSSGLVANGTRKDLLGNSMVIITARGGPKITNPQDLTAIKHLSLADPKAVPAGIYAKAFLTKVGLWPALEAKVIPAENVRAAMAVIESGNAEAAIVYKTDAAISKNVHVAFAIPASDTPKIIYPAAILKDSRNAAAAGKFLNYLAAPQAHETFLKFGFSVID